MKNLSEIEKILDVINENDRFLITSHMDPDGDSIGSQLGLFYALKDLGKKSYIVDQGQLPAKYDFLDPENLIKGEANSIPFSPQVTVFVECPEIKRIGFVSDLLPPESIKINIDHHHDNDNYGDLNWVDTECCAAGEMIYYILREGKFNITPVIAMELYAAIVSDTGQFKFSSTSANGMKAASELIQLGANPKMISDKIFSRFAPETIKLLGNTLGNMAIVANGKIAVTQISRNDLKASNAKLENSEGFVDYLLSVAQIELGILFKEIDDKTVKVSLRSQNGVDASKLAREFNGGGHINAAGFTVNGALKEVKDKVVKRATEYIHAK